jgi:hypothetical protein
MPPQGAGYAAAPSGAPAAVGRTVFGVPLEPDERVVYFKQVPQLGGLIAVIFVGILMLVVLIGIFFIVQAFRNRTIAVHAQVITNRRVMTINGKGQILSQLRWRDVAGMYTKLINGRLSEVGVRTKASVNVLFGDSPHLAQPIFERYCGDLRLLEKDPEVPFTPNVV